MDAEGKPSTDPTKVLEGAQMPFGAYKGCNIALLVELLSAGVFPYMYMSLLLLSRT